MREQPSLHPYSTEMPVMPSATVPTSGSLRVLTAEQSKLSSNPLPKSKVNTHNGKVYYGYYCLMCHGENGDGNGPVGQSYVPKPTDLGSANVTSLTDGQIYAKMLSGKGHAPVMSETVSPDQRWQIVMYVRTFSR